MLLIDKIKKNSEVIKHSATVHITNNLTLLDRKIFNILLKNAYDELGKKRFHEVRIRDLMKIVGWKNNDDTKIKESLEKLVGTSLKINIFGKDKTSESSAIISLLASAVCPANSGYCSYQYPDLLKDMFQSPNIYAKLDLNIQNKFKSKHSIALWEYFIEILSVSKRDNATSKEIPISSLKRMLDLEDSRYKEFKLLNQKIIKPSLNEINKKSELSVEVEFVKEGRRVNALIFFLKKKHSSQNSKKEELVKDAEIMDEITNIANENYLEENPLFKTLTKDFIVSTTVAYELLKTYPEEQIRANLEYIKEHAKNNQIRNYGAFTVKAIKQNYQIQESPEEIAEKKRMEELKIRMEEERKKAELKEKKQEEEIKKILSTKWWKSVKEKLQEEYGNDCQKWFKDMKPLTLEDNPNELLLCFPSKFLRDWVRREFLEKSEFSKSKRNLSDIVIGDNDNYENLMVIYKE